MRSNSSIVNNSVSIINNSLLVQVSSPIDNLVFKSDRMFSGRTYSEGSTVYRSDVPFRATLIGVYSENEDFFIPFSEVREFTLSE